LTPADHDYQPSRELVEDVVADESAQFGHRVKKRL
jgi:hypothetical protein